MWAWTVSFALKLAERHCAIIWLLARAVHAVVMIQNQLALSHPASSAKSGQLHQLLPVIKEFWGSGGSCALRIISTSMLQHWSTCCKGNSAALQPCLIHWLMSRPCLHGMPKRCPAWREAPRPQASSLFCVPLLALAPASGPRTLRCVPGNSLPTPAAPAEHVVLRKPLEACALCRLGFSDHFLPDPAAACMLG